MGWGSVIAGVLLLVKFNVPVLWLTLALSAIGGATAVASSVGVETLAQERTARARPRPRLRLAAGLHLAGQPAGRRGRRSARRSLTSVLTSRFDVAAVSWSARRRRRQCCSRSPLLENGQHAWA
jgi:hypothetical protein